jgi:acyl-CoA reductase-like NAD-dependent aldehyde dehydrogenase
MKIINPYTEKVIAEVKEDTKETLNTKFEILKTHQKTWASVNIRERVKIVLNFVTLLKENVDNLALILTSEMGKPLRQSKNEVFGAAGKAEWLANNAIKYLQSETISEGPTSEIIKYEPLGVVANISAWNYPYNVGVNVFVPALLAGNAVLYKPSEYATLTGLEIEKLLKKAGVPDGVFQMAIGGSETGKNMLDLNLDLIGFTGSYTTGKSIYEYVADRMIPCIMELGGKDPVYVTNDVTDLKSAATSLADGAFYNNGQSCCSVERIYVHRDVYEEFCSHFTEEVKSWKVGDPMEDGVYISVLSRKDQVKLLDRQVSDALEKGAELVCGGKRIEGKEYGFKPTVLKNVNNQMDVMREESFGPIIGIMKVNSDEEAISLMNDTSYGLTAGVYSSSQARAEQILEKTDAGSGYWNCCDRVSAALPWSGRKNSGFGSTLSHLGLRAFTKPKAYHLRAGG